MLLEPIPELTGRGSEISGEVLRLDAADDAIIDLAYDAMVDEFPHLSSMTSTQQARTREDLRWMARFTAGALLTNDKTIVEELLTWLCRLLAGKVPMPVITTSAHVLADVIAPTSGAGATILRGAAAKVAVDLSGAGKP